MPTQDPSSKLRVLIVGGGVAALESVLALAELAPGMTATTVLAPNTDLVDRPMTVREPFAYPRARHTPLEPIVRDGGAELVCDELAWVDPVKHVAHTKGEAELEYDVLVLALGGRICPRYTHAITIDDRKLDELLHGLIQDIEGGYVKRLAFVAPGRMAWPLPLYELALMSAARAYDMNVQMTTTIVTPEDRPLAIFGREASEAVGDLLGEAGIQTITSAYAEIPRNGEIRINPGERHLNVDRIVALPELYGPSVRGVPLSEHGFLRVDIFGKLLEAEDIYAAGDATEFPVKHGGVASQQADVVAQSIAARAGAAVQPEPFHPVIRGMLLTGGEPRYLTARLTGGAGFSSEVTDAPTWSPPSKIASKYLAPYLEAHSPAIAG
ncbi:MAG: FAD-dependent oxidoreductase [Solirubrobacteraceae bacterium]